MFMPRGYVDSWATIGHCQSDRQRRWWHTRSSMRRVIRLGCWNSIRARSLASLPYQLESSMYVQTEGRLAERNSAHQLRRQANDIRLPIPPCDEQSQRGFIGARQPSTHSSERKTSATIALREYRPALITAAVTGQIDVATAAPRRRPDGQHHKESAFETAIEEHLLGHGGSRATREQLRPRRSRSTPASYSPSSARPSRQTWAKLRKASMGPQSRRTVVDSARSERSTRAARSTSCATAFKFHGQAPPVWPTSSPAHGLNPETLALYDAEPPHRHPPGALRPSERALHRPAA